MTPIASSTGRHAFMAARGRAPECCEFTSSAISASTWLPRRTGRHSLYAWRGIDISARLTATAIASEATVPRMPARATSADVEHQLDAHENRHRLSLARAGLEAETLRGFHGFGVETELVGVERLHDVALPHRPRGEHDAVEPDLALDAAHHRVGRVTRLGA